MILLNECLDVDVAVVCGGRHIIRTLLVLAQHGDAKVLDEVL